MLWFELAPRCIERRILMKKPPVKVEDKCQPHVVESICAFSTAFTFVDWRHNATCRTLPLSTWCTDCLNALSHMVTMEFTSWRVSTNVISAVHTNGFHHAFSSRMEVLHVKFAERYKKVELTVGSSNGILQCYFSYNTSFIYGDS